jgi:hypothetical protein
MSNGRIEANPTAASPPIEHPNFKELLYKVCS